MPTEGQRCPHEQRLDPGPEDRREPGHTNGRDKCRVERIIRESEEDTCLAHTTVTNEQQFK
jgi:hypothetical protein